jgi:hypothetical protein
MPFKSFLRGFARMSTRPPKVRPKGAAGAEPFHAVAVQVGSNACSGSARIRGKRFLATAAPPLPLPGCDRTICKCRYVHFPDRRDDARRAVDVGMHSPPRRDGERRGLRAGRRNHDAPHLEQRNTTPQAAPKRR